MIRHRYLFLACLALSLSACVPPKKGDSVEVVMKGEECEQEKRSVLDRTWDKTKDFVCKTSGMCGYQKVKMIISHPAEIDLVKYKTVAFAEIQGDYGESFAAALKETMVKNGNLTVMDRTELDKVLKELGMTQEDFFDQQRRVKLGKLMPATALVMGKVNSEFKKEKRQKKETCGFGKKSYPCTKTVEFGTANMNADISIVEVETSGAIQVKHLSATSEDNTNKIFDSIINERELHEGNLKQIVTEMAKAVLPFNTKEKIVFYVDGDLPQLERGIPDLEAGDLEKAKDRFLKAIEDNKDNTQISQKTLAKAYFDLGLLYMYTQEFDKGATAFETVDDLALKAFPAGEMRLLVKCLQAEDEKRKLQTASR